MKNASPRARQLLAQMAAIARMERGALCRLRGRRQYNHQTWQDGRNVVRYVRPEEAAALQEAIGGYARFRALAEQYADEIIRRTRAQRPRHAAKKSPPSPPSSPPPENVHPTPTPPPCP